MKTKTNNQGKKKKKAKKAKEQQEEVVQTLAISAARRDEVHGLVLQIMGLKPGEPLSTHTQFLYNRFGEEYPNATSSDMLQRRVNVWFSFLLFIFFLNTYY